MVFGLLALLTVTTAAIAFAVPSEVRSTSTRAAVEMATVLLAALAGCLLVGRARALRRRRDLAIAWGAGLFAVTQATFSLLPVLASDTAGDIYRRADAGAWLLLAVILAAAATTPAALLDRLGPRTWIGLCALLVAVPLMLLAGLSASAGSWQALQIAALLPALVAAAAITRTAWAGDESQAWVAGAVLALGAAHLHAGLNPALSAQWTTTGELLCLAAAVMLLVAGLRQLGTYHGAATRLALAEERRRIARDLHDGLAQELAYIAGHAPRLAARSEDPLAGRLAEAAACALDESRQAISALASDPQEPLGRALERAAERIVSREGGVVRADLEDGVEVEPAVRRDLLRIVREATTNAVLHGGAGEVSLSLSGGEVMVLQIADDGVGFRPVDGVVEGSRSGFGLTSMQERAERAGGNLFVRSEPGRGTIVEVRID